MPASRPDARRASHRQPLSRPRALATALAVADESGIEALTMRRLANELGVEAMSLYHHVAGKDDILDGMIELVFAEIDLPGDDLDWRSAMRHRARSFRDALIRHPWAIGLLESRRSPGPSLLRHHDWMIGRCRRAGFSLEAAAHAFWLIDSFVYGSALQQISLPFTDDTDMADAAASMLPGAHADQYPHLAALVAEVVAEDQYRVDDQFERGLDLILGGLSSRD